MKQRYTYKCSVASFFSVFSFTRSLLLNIIWLHLIAVFFVKFSLEADKKRKISILSTNIRYKKTAAWNKKKYFPSVSLQTAARDSKKGSQNVIFCGHNLFIVAWGDVAQMVNQSASPII